MGRLSLMINLEDGQAWLAGWLKPPRSWGAALDRHWIGSILNSSDRTLGGKIPPIYPVGHHDCYSSTGDGK